MQQGKLSKGDRLGPADHSKIDYPPFRRNFYIEVPEVARMTDQQVAERRKALDGIKVWIAAFPRVPSVCTICAITAEALSPAGCAAYQSVLRH